MLPSRIARIQPSSIVSRMSSKSVLAAKPPALAANFPVSHAEPSRLFTFTGVTRASTEAVREVLTENDHAYDMWMKKMRFAHNHFSHSALTRYALGAPPDLIREEFVSEQPSLAPLDPREGGRNKELEGVPDVINRDNWRDKRWFGKKGAHSVYLPFFHEEVARLGIDGAVQEYIFSPAANHGDIKMLAGLISGVVHPIIHIGFGLEFNDPLMVAEGLAQTCQHDPTLESPMFPKNWPEEHLQITSGKPKRPLFALYAEFLDNPAFYPGEYDTNALINDRLRLSLNEKSLPALHDLVARWELGDLATEQAVADRLEELAWVATLLCGATSRPGYKTRIDFFLMHILTSSLFIPSYTARFRGDERRIILQGYALILFHICMVRGRPALYPDVAMGYTDFPTGPLSRMGKGKLPMVGDGAADKNNPWLQIVDNALVAYDSHVPKSIRSLLHYSQLYGHKGANAVPGATENGKELVPGISKVDGTLFVRVAGRIMDYTGWVKETGDNTHDWDRSALGWNEAWQDEKKSNL